MLEAELEETEAGLVPASTVWFVLNARDARWFDCADETAARYIASSPEDTQDGTPAYARFPLPQATATARLVADD